MRACLFLNFFQYARTMYFFFLCSFFLWRSGCLTRLMNAKSVRKHYDFVIIAHLVPDDKYMVNVAIDGEWDKCKQGHTAPRSIYSTVCDAKCFRYRRKLHSRQFFSRCLVDDTNCCSVFHFSRNFFSSSFEFFVDQNSKVSNNCSDFFFSRISAGALNVSRTIGERTD